MRINLKLLVVTLLTLFIIACALSSCQTSKQVSKSSTKETVDSSAINTLQTRIKQLELENQHYIGIIARHEQTGVVFEDRCDTAALRKILSQGNCPEVDINRYLSKINQQQNEILFYKDGNIKLTGSIASYSRDLKELEQTIMVLKNERDTYKEENQTVKTELEKTKAEMQMEKNVKKTAFPWWLVVIVIILSILYIKEKLPSRSGVAALGTNQ